jgi:hypothetical protein
MAPTTTGRSLHVLPEVAEVTSQGQREIKKSSRGNFGMNFGFE